MGPLSWRYVRKSKDETERLQSLFQSIAAGRFKRDVKRLVQVLRHVTGLVHARIEKHISRTGINQECKVSGGADGEVPKPESLVSLS
jgi:hypothetical protein